MPKPSKHVVPRKPKLRPHDPPHDLDDDRERSQLSWPPVALGRPGTDKRMRDADRLNTALGILLPSIDAIADRQKLTTRETLGIIKRIEETYRERLAGLEASPIKSTPQPTTLPTRAPALWLKRDRNEPENPAQFTRRVYGTWLGKGLTRRDLRVLDPELYRALSVWMHRHPEDAIAELPPLTAEMDKIIDRLSAELSLEELRKLGYAIDSRLRRMKK
jgi:hypothetical protein